MRTLLLATTLLVAGVAISHAQPEGDGTGVQIDIAPLQRSSSASDTNYVPEADEFVPVEQEAHYDEGDLQRRIKYPAAARDMGIQGTVIVRALISRTGRVDRVIIDQSSNKILEKAAVDAVRETPFTPALQRNQPVATWKQINVEFKIESSDPPPPPSNLSEANGRLKMADFDAMQTQTRRMESRRERNTQTETTNGKRYDQEHGSMKARLTMNQIEGITTTTWDRYGQRMLTTFTSINPEDSMINFRSIEADGYRTTYTTTAMGVLGRRKSLSGGVHERIPDVQSLVSMLRSAAPPGMIHTAPPRTIAGQKAEGIEIDTMGMVMRVWTRGKLTLAAEIVIPETPRTPAMSMMMEVTELDLKRKVPASTFDPPADASIIDDDSAPSR